jgi:hypothetical protein
MRAGLFIASLFAIVTLVQKAEAQSCAATSYSSTQIAQAVAASPNANQALKSTSCTWGGAGKSESGGNLCSSNAGNSGVLQLSNANLAAYNGMSPTQYMALPLQNQVDIWAGAVGNSNTSSTGYQTLAAQNATGGSLGATPVSSGQMAACFQFGAVICNNDVRALQSGQTCGGANPVIATGGQGGTLRNGTATEDGNGQSICSWGRNIQANINAAAATCKNGGADCAPSNLTDLPAQPPSLPSDIVVS